MPRGLPTLQDVAERAGVSRATVSLALSDHPKAQSFSSTTIERIQLVARELGYRPNFFASQLRRKTARLVMVYVETLQDLYAGSVAESFVRQAALRGYWTMVNASPRTPRKPVFDERIIGGHGISAVAVISTVADAITQRELRRMRDDGVRVVAIGRRLEGADASSIVVDDYQGGWLAAEHVYGLGARRVWLTSGPTTGNAPRQARCQAALECAERLGHPAPVVLPEPAEPHVATEPLAIHQAAYQTMRTRLSASAAPPEAVIANPDLRAMGVYRALYEADLQPGRDVAVVGYDDIWPAQMMYPPLSTVHQPTAEMGRAAADVLIDTLEGHVRPGRVVNVSPQLAVRDSTSSWRRR